MRFPTNAGRSALLDAEKRARADEVAALRKRADDADRKLADALRQLTEKPKGNPELEKKLQAEIDRQAALIKKLEGAAAGDGQGGGGAAGNGPPSLGMKKLLPSMTPHELIKGLQDMSAPLMKACKDKGPDATIALSFADVKLVYENVMACGQAAVNWKNNPNALNGNGGAGGRGDDAKDDPSQPSRIRKVAQVLPKLDIEVRIKFRRE